MADNTIKSQDIHYGLTREFIANFNQETSALQNILGIVSPEVVGAGYGLTQYKVTGTLNNSESSSDGTGTSGTGYIEGDLVALSKYQMTEKPIGKAKLRPYRKVTTGQAIAERGNVAAVVRTDAKMLADIRNDIVKDFFTFLGTGTGTATGKGVQAALAYGGAALADAMETHGDTPRNIIYFVNRADVADYLSSALVTMQTVFGMQYVNDFLGVQNMFITNRVPKGTFYVVDSANLHLYAQDFSALTASGLNYTISDDGLIGVAHGPIYDHVSVETNVLTGMLLFAEVTDYIIKGTITDDKAGK